MKIGKTLGWIAAGTGAALAVRGLLLAAGKIDFRDKVVLITGGSRGLGFAMAEEFAGAGARLVICARNPEALERASDSFLTALGREPAQKLHQAG